MIISVGLQGGKQMYCLLDTNIISDYLKGVLRIDEEIIYRFSSSLQFCIPALSLAELSKWDGMLDNLVDIALCQHRLRVL